MIKFAYIYPLGLKNRLNYKSIQSLQYFGIQIIEDYFQLSLRQDAEGVTKQSKKRYSTVKYRYVNKTIRYDAQDGGSYLDSFLRPLMDHGFILLRCEWFICVVLRTKKQLH